MLSSHLVLALSHLTTIVRVLFDLSEILYLALKIKFAAFLLVLSLDYTRMGYF